MSQIDPAPMTNNGDARSKKPQGGFWLKQTFSLGSANDGLWDFAVALKK